MVRRNFVLDIVYLNRIPVRVRAGAVVCPVATVPGYLEAEIFSEGSHRSNVTWFAILPQEDCGLQSANWIAEQLAAMRWLRESNVNPLPDPIWLAVNQAGDILWQINTLYLFLINRAKAYPFSLA